VLDIHMELAHKSEEFKGADIKGSCILTSLNTINRTFPWKSTESKTKIQDDLDQVTVNHRDFSSAIEELMKKISNYKFVAS
jgi:SpoVK/Ycf46/Vps4 family AAA+-type ATPase